MSTPTRKLKRAATVANSCALVTNSSGEATTSATTATEIGYVSGVTSSIQTQLDSKADGLSYILTATTTDATQTELLNGAAQIVIPANTSWLADISMVCRRPTWGSFTVQDSSRDWSDVACSDSGQKVVAVVNTGFIYTSTDYGDTWTQRATSNAFNAVASDSTGTNLIAVETGSYVWTSSDSGANWTEQTGGIGGAAFDPVAIAMSSDGSKAVLADFGGTLYTSTDFGVSWTARDSTRDWIAVCSSSDGTKLAAVVSGGQIYTSNDSGVNWTARASNLGWIDIDCSDDGVTLVATISGGNIYTSSDSGVNWTSRATSELWTGAACSSDGARMFATYSGTGFKYSLDSGVTWIAGTAPSVNLSTLCCNSTGLLLFATPASTDTLFVMVAGSEREATLFSALANRDLLVSSVTVDDVQQNPIGTPGNTFTIDADTSTGALRVRGTGAANEEWSWRAVVTLNQIATE